MKKTIFIPIGILMLAGIVLASFFYFGKNEKIKVSNAESDIQQKDAKVTVAKFPVAGDKIKILFLGDLMFDRWIRQVSEKRGGDFVFQKVKNLLQSEDLVVGNLEGPITKNSSVSVGSEFGAKENYIFTFPKETATELFRENIRLVNLGNNHILNQGASGLASTESYLKAAGVDFFGDPQAEETRSKNYEAGGLKISFINYNQFVGDGAAKTMENIQKSKEEKADIIIIYAHWGTEFVAEPSQKIKNLAHQFTDAGADLVIGSHPHVVQMKEEYKNKMIYYSLGNFIFDQYFQPETERGMGVEADIDPISKKINFREYNFTLSKNGQTAPI